MIIKHFKEMWKNKNLSKLMENGIARNLEIVLRCSDNCFYVNQDFLVKVVLRPAEL